jgi:hypothetical protein
VCGALCVAQGVKSNPLLPLLPAAEGADAAAGGGGDKGPGAEGEGGDKAAGAEGEGEGGKDKEGSVKPEGAPPAKVRPCLAWFLWCLVQL